jgi:hypothetical protein
MGKAVDKDGEWQMNNVEQTSAILLLRYESMALGEYTPIPSGGDEIDTKKPTETELNNMTRQQLVQHLEQEPGLREWWGARWPSDPKRANRQTLAKRLVEYYWPDTASEEPDTTAAEEPPHETCSVQMSRETLHAIRDLLAFLEYRPSDLVRQAIGDFLREIDTT